MSETKINSNDSLIVPRLSKFAWVCIVLMVLFLTWQWLSTRYHFHEIEKSLSHQLEAQRTNNEQSLLLAKQSDERSEQANARTIILEQKLSESQSEQAALHNLYDELSGNQEKSIISEVEQLLTLAHQQLLLANNVKSALLALQSADVRLQSVDTQQAKQLRTAIAEDMRVLQNVPNVDVVGISIKLNQLAESVSTIPLLSERTLNPQQSNLNTTSGGNSSHLGFLSDFWSDIKNLVQVKRISQTDVALVTPDQAFYLRENLKLRFLTTRIALLQRDEDTYRADLKAAELTLKSLFNTNDKQTQFALNTIKNLSDSHVVIETPDIESLDMVNKYKLSLDTKKNRP